MIVKTWNDLNILVTRTHPFARTLLAQLTANGAKTWHLPGLDVELKTDTASVKAAIAELTHFKWQIFVSRHAVQAALPQIVAKWSMLDLAQLSWASVGVGTQVELAHYIKSDILYPQHGVGSEALLTELEGKIQQNDTALIWCGNAATEILIQGLQARGVDAHAIVCYQRKKASIDPQAVQSALRAGEINLVIASSGEVLENLVSLLTPVHAQLMNCTLVVVSERLADLARQLGFSGKIIVATGADDDAIIHTISDSILNSAQSS